MRTVIFCILIFSFAIRGQQIYIEADKLYNKGNYSSFIQLLKNNIPEDSSFYNHWFKLGISYQKIHNYEKANDALYIAYKYNKFDINLNLALGRNHNYCGSPGYSLLFFQQAFELDSSNTNVLIELANTYSEVREYDRAINVYKKLIAADSSNAYYFKRIGKCFYKLGKANEARQFLQKSFKLNPRDATVALLLGGLFVNNSDYMTALKIIKDGLYHNGQSLPLLKLFAETLFKMKRYTDASVHYEAIISAGDSSASHFRRLGFCYYLPASIKNFEEEITDSLIFLNAINAFNHAIRKDSSDALSHIYLGICKKERGEYFLATDFIKRGIELALPGYLVDAYSQLASSYELNDEYAEAIKAYKKARELNSERETLVFQLASIYDRYYKDKRTPLLYYQKFVNESNNAEASLIEYAKLRIQYLIEKLHFKRQ